MKLHYQMSWGDQYKETGSPDEPFYHLQKRDRAYLLTREDYFLGIIPPVWQIECPVYYTRRDLVFDPLEPPAVYDGYYGFHLPDNYRGVSYLLAHAASIIQLTRAELPSTA